MIEDYVSTRRGQDCVLLEGLLQEAPARGGRDPSATLVQSPTAENGRRAICSARVTTPSGSFTGLGEAHPDSAGRADVATLLLASQIRAKARALCDALNLGLTPTGDLPS